VPKYSPETKSSARAGQEASEWTRSICGALGIDGYHRYLYAAAFFDLLARVTGRIAEDPPRSDFTISTHVRPRFATPGYIQTNVRFERLALEAAEAADDAEAHLAAHLRAFERFQGAVKAQRPAEASERIGEALTQARTSSQALRQLADPVSAIADELSGASGLSRMEGRSGRPRIDQVSEEGLGVLFLGGLRIRDLENVLSGTRLDDTKVAARRLVTAAKRFRELSGVLERWAPPDESDLVL
jgi:hypothetical protein